LGYLAAIAAAASCLQQEVANHAAAVAESLLAVQAGRRQFDLAIDSPRSQACMAGTGQQQAVAVG
jgi:hypothetical protein